MLNASTADMFKDNKEEAIKKCKELGHYGKVLKNIEEFAKKERFYSMHYIYYTPGTFGNNTSNYSEINHSSVMAHLTKNFCTDLDVLLLSLLERQKKLTLRTQQLIIKDENHMRYHQARLENKSIKDKAMIDAATFLNKKGFNFFLQMYNNHTKYTRDVFYDDDDNEDRVQVYLSASTDFDQFREFDHHNSPCDCVDFVSYRVQCVHRFVYLQKFNLADYDIRYHRRKNITRSCNIGSYSSNHMFQELITKSLNIAIDEKKSIHDKYLSISDGVKTYDNNEELVCVVDDIGNSNCVKRNEIEDKSISSLYEKSWMELGDFQKITEKIHAGMCSHRKYGTLMIGEMLKILDFFEKYKEMEETPATMKEMEKDFLQRIQEHKVMFTTKSTKDIIFASHITYPTRIHNVQYAKKKRIKSSAEAVYSNVKKARNTLQSSTAQKSFDLTFTKAITNVKKQKKCSFCKSVSCAKTRNCSVKEKYGKIIENASNYLSYLKDDAPYRDIKNIEINSFVANPDFSTLKHLQVVEIVCKTKKSAMSRPSEDQFLVKINAINENGHVMSAMENILVSLSELPDIVTDIVRKKQRYVFSKVELSMGEEFDCVKRAENNLFEISQIATRSYHPSQLSQLTMTPHNNFSHPEIYRQLQDYDTQDLLNWRFEI